VNDLAIFFFFAKATIGKWFNIFFPDQNIEETPLQSTVVPNHCIEAL
jgi:hypothetical protein